MKLPRPTSEQDRLDLKAATRRALELARPTKFAPVTRVDAAALSRYGAISEPEKFMPIDVVVDLCRDIGSPILVEEMARLLGYRLVPIEEPAEGGKVDLQDISDLSRENSDVVVALAAGLKDGFDASHRREALRELSEERAMLHRIEHKVAGGGE